MKLKNFVGFDYLLWCNPVRVPCEVVLVALLNLGNGPKEEFHLFLVWKLVLKVYEAIGIPSDEDRGSK
jgi:hypothetical protein